MNSDDYYNIKINSTEILNKNITVFIDKPLPQSHEDLLNYIKQKYLTRKLLNFYEKSTIVQNFSFQNKLCKVY